MDAGHRSFAIDDATLKRAADTLRRGGLVAFPTETVYGLGANALDAAAVACVFQVKARPHFDPLIVHVADAADARRLTTDWPPLAQQLADAFWPGPLTLVLPKVPAAVPDLVTAGLPTVALRVPAHPAALALLRAAELPVAAPSANRFGGVSPTTAAHVQSELRGEVDVILDGGPSRTGVESTVVSLVDPNRPRVLRLGGLPVEAIEEAVGPVTVATPTVAEREAEQRGQQSPGMLERHYAPRTPMRVVERLADFDFHGTASPGESHRHADKPLISKVGLLAFRQDANQAKVEARKVSLEVTAIETLSTTGDLVEAAANLFAAMRRLDASGVDLIVAEHVPDIGLGRAINDRLRRAATP